MKCKRNFSPVTGNEIYQRIIFLIKNRNIKRDVFYLETGLSRQTIAKWKKGSLPSADTVIVLSEYFIVSPYWLLTGKTIDISDSEAYKHRYLAELEKFKDIIESL